MSGAHVAVDFQGLYTVKTSTTQYKGYVKMT